MAFSNCFWCSVSSASIWWCVSSLIAWICGARSWRETTWIFVEQRLNSVVVLLKQRSDLVPLLRGEFQILCQMIEFLIDRPRAVDRRACLIRLLRLPSISLAIAIPVIANASMPVNTTVKKVLIDKRLR